MTQVTAFFQFIDWIDAAIVFVKVALLTLGAAGACWWLISRGRRRT